MLKLTKEQETLFALLQGKSMTDTASIDWKALIKEAQSQAIFLMLKQPKNLPEEINALWQKLTFALVKTNMEEFFAVTEMKRMMDSIQQPYVLLKGISSASYYPDIFERALGDVDFLIDTKYQPLIEETLQKNGYESNGVYNDHHVAYIKDKQDLEMHFAIPGLPNGKLADVISDYIKDILKEPKKINVNGTDLNIPLPEYHGIIILLHMLNHMITSGFGLRHLIDWCYFVDKTADESFWENDLIPLMKNVGLFYYAQVMTKTGALYLGTKEADWCKDVDEKMCDDIMNDILSSGNFGRKNKTRSSGHLMMTKYKNDKKKDNKIYNLWLNLLEHVEGYHPIVKKHPILYPIFIFTFMCNRIRKVLTGKRAPLIKVKKYAEERENIYNKLKLFDVQ